MPSWLAILFLLLALTALIVAVLWYAGILSAAGDARRTDTSVTAGSGIQAPARQAEARPLPSPSAKPPPALAGPHPGAAIVIEASLSPRRAAPPPAAAVDPRPRTGQQPEDFGRPPRRAAPPPAAAAGPAANPSAAGRGGQTRSTKPPPAQAAWDPPSAKPRDNKR